MDKLTESSDECRACCSYPGTQIYDFGQKRKKDAEGCKAQCMLEDILTSDISRTGLSLSLSLSLFYPALLHRNRTLITTYEIFGSINPSISPRQSLLQVDLFGRKDRLTSYYQKTTRTPKGSRIENVSAFERDRSTRSLSSIPTLPVSLSKDCLSRPS